MPRKQKKYHYIYKTTNNLNGKYYIGMHSTDDLNDGYMGSGKRLWYSFNYHGKDNHTVEILEFCDNREELRKRESDIVTDDLLREELCINLKVGGEGGWHKYANEAFKHKMENDSEFRKSFSNRMVELNIRWRKEGKFEVNGFKGKTHSEESKLKISESKRGVPVGVGKSNSQYGTCWVTKDGVDKKVTKDTINNYLSDGWVKGRGNYVKPPTNKKTGATNGNSKLDEEKVLEIKRLLSEDKISTTKIAETFGVSRPTIDDIKKGKTWSHLQLSE